MKKILFIALLALGYYAYTHAGSKNATPLRDPVAATQLARESNKILIISVTSENCGRSKGMKQSVKDGNVDFGKEHFVWLDIDYYKEPMQWFRKNYSIKANVFPTFVAVSGNGKVLNYTADITSDTDLSAFLNRSRVLDR